MEEHGGAVRASPRPSPKEREMLSNREYYHMNRVK